MNRTKSIYISILNQGCVRPELSQLITHWTHQGKYNLNVVYSSEKPIQHNRNEIVQNFLKTDYDYLMMIDGDIIPPPEILDLADLQKDIIGGLCFAYRQDYIMPLILKEKPKEPDSYNVLQVGGYEGLIEVDAIGTGCILIKREVLERKEMKRPFWNYYDENGLRYAGLDLTFCKRVRELGYKIWCHLNYPCSHWTTFDLKVAYDAIRMNQTLPDEKTTIQQLGGSE